MQVLTRSPGNPALKEAASASALDTQALILRELQELSRRLTRIEEAIPVLAALAAGSEADAALREQRRTRQARGRRDLADKLGAPAGIGALYVRDPARLAPLMLGGPQEYGVRAGTPNLAGAARFGVAADTCTPARVPMGPLMLCHATFT